MQYSEETFSSIKDVYKTVGNIYSSFSFLPYFIIVVCLIIMFVYCVKIEVNTSKNWNKDKCSSKYIFFSGFMKSEGKDPFKQTMKNFVECINPNYNISIFKKNKIKTKDKTNVESNTGSKTGSNTFINKIKEIF